MSEAFLQAITDLGIRYATMADGEDREDVLLVIVRAFHAYVLKYADRIQRGHLPVYRGHANQDSVAFLRRFLRLATRLPTKGLKLACRTMHLAFSGQSYDEVYNILVGLLIKVIHSYDPRYTDKIKLVAEAIERLENPDEIITGLELDLDFDRRRFLRFDDPQRQPNLSLSPGSARSSV